MIDFDGLGVFTLPADLARAVAGRDVVIYRGDLINVSAFGACADENCRTIISAPVNARTNAICRALNNGCVETDYANVLCDAATGGTNPVCPSNLRC
jgi:hypothetical protein